jgi:RNA polymerase sigma-70 factor (ECF subfamily)
MIGFLTFLVSPQSVDPMDSDVSLVERHLDGDDDAFAALVERYEASLYGFLARFTGDATLAEDIFQETFLQVYRSAAMFDLTRSFRPWLFTVAANKARDVLRKKGRRPEMPLDAPLSSGDGRETTFADLIPSKIPSPDEISSNHETRAHVQGMVQEMPETLREVLSLSYFKELPHKEIAEILAIPVGTVKSRLHAAVRAFSEKYTVYLNKQSRDERDEHDLTN